MKQPKYKPGDIVKIREDLSPKVRYEMYHAEVSDVAVSSMLRHKGKIVTIESIYSRKYQLKEVEGYWTDEMFEDLAEEISSASKYLEKPIKAKDYVEKTKNISNSKALNPLHSEYPQGQTNISVEASEPSKSEQKLNQKPEIQMKKLDLILLFQFLAAQTAEKVDATNAKHIGILVDYEGSYIGYVYANTIKELHDIIRKPENEGRKLHIFDYSQTIAQKARPVVKVDRV